MFIIQNVNGRIRGVGGIDLGACCRDFGECHLELAFRCQQGSNHSTAGPRQQLCKLGGKNFFFFLGGELTVGKVYYELP